MSGHSKWNNIKNKKEKTDAQKAKIFTKIGREMAVVIKEGGADPDTNSKLRDLIAKAKANNVPNDNIDRAIKKAAGANDTSNYEDVMYEGYGPCGVAVIVEALTDNRNRTAGDLRHYFDKFGGNLGAMGCVSFMFQRKGVLAIPAEGLEEDKVMEDALEAGAVDFLTDGEYFIVYTEPNDVSGVRADLETKGYPFETAEIQYIPDTYSRIDDEDARIKMNRLIEMLEDNDDVQNIWHNWENPDEDEAED